MAAVFPENMNRLDVSNVEESLSTIDAYIRYIVERVEFSVRNITKTVNDAGSVSYVELYMLVMALNNDVSALKSTVSGLGGTVEALKTSVSDIEKRLSALEAT